jgi:hypothetical protein
LSSIAPDVTDRLAGYADNDLVPDTVCKKALGGVSDMTWWRWERDERLDFPEAHYLRGRKFRRAGDVRHFRKQHFGF